MMDILHAVQADLHKDWDTDLLEEYIERRGRCRSGL